jgi:hypothetical protein
VFWPGSLERIAVYNPAMRLILMLRDPVERAYSGWQMEYARGVETLPFSAAIREGRERLAGLPVHHPARREFSYVERGFYGAQAQRLLSLFPRGQLLVECAGDLRASPAAVLDRVYTHIGLDPPPAPPAPRVVHAAASIDYGPGLGSEDAAYLRNLYADDLAVLRNLTGVAF